MLAPCALLAALLGSPALAQDDGVLPVLVDAPPPVYPTDALASGDEAQVLLQLVVLPDGTVADATVVESAGPAFDAAAVAAARDFRFEPARDARGEPVAATILYRTVFTLDAVPTRSAEGWVRKAGAGTPVVGAEITAVGPDGQVRTAFADEDGAFAFVDLAPGPWTVSVTAPGFDVQTGSFTVRDGVVAGIELFPVETRPWEAADLVIEVRGPRRPPEVTERALTQEEIRYLPGTAGDVVRVVQNLPGVARPPLNIGQLLIRGVAPEDSAYYVDGVRIPIVFHFSGLSTVVNGDALEEVVFFPGNFGARYGGILGGGVDLRFDPELPERTNGYASFDVFQGTLYHEQKLSETTALTVSGRRSWVDAILTPVLSSGATSFQAPRYYDGQVRLLHDAGALGTVDALVFFSDDRFRIVGGDDDEGGTFRIGLSTAFQKARLQWNRTTADGWRSETTLLAGPERQEFEISPSGEAYERSFALGLRHELSRGLGDGGRVRFGIDATSRREDLLYDVPFQGPREAVTVWRHNPAVYVEPTFPIRDLRVTPGLRLDPLFQGDQSSLAVDPRLSARWLASPTTEVKASTGIYSQHPTARQIADRAPGTTLGPARSIQSSVGLVQDLSASLTVETVLFYNRLEDLVVGREDRFRFYSGPPPIGPFDTAPYANDGTGDIFGSEVQVRLDTARTTGWVAATFSRSLRVKRPGDDRRLFAYDQPVVLTAVATHELPRGWRLGGRVRYGSGNPYTPVVNKIYQLDTRTFLPVYGEPDSARLPGFFSLDLRVDKAWTYERWTLSTYLDLQNATNAQNPEVMSWTYDYSAEDPVTSLPLLPIIGVRADW